MISVIIVKKKSINAYLIGINDYQSNQGINKCLLTSISNINCEKNSFSKDYQMVSQKEEIING